MSKMPQFTLGIGGSVDLDQVRQAARILATALIERGCDKVTVDRSRLISFWLDDERKKVNDGNLRTVQ